MLTLATQTFVDGIWILSPEEPASLALALAGLGTIAIYAALTHRSLRRTAAPVSAKKLSPAKQSNKKARDNRRRRAA